MKQQKYNAATWPKSIFWLTLLTLMGCNSNPHNTSPGTRTQYEINTIDEVTHQTNTHTNLSTPALPDLSISNISVEPKPAVVAGYAVLLRGVDYRFIIEVMNKGPGTMTKAINVAVQYGCQGPGVARKFSVGAIATNDFTQGKIKFSRPFNFKIPVTKSAGTCRFIFTVDPDNITEEVDERDSSNVWTTTVTIH